MTSLERLEKWYSSHCNGDWEHQCGVRINTLDNPGWRMQINLRGTKAETEIFNRMKLDRTKDDWLNCWTENQWFNAACGPSNLSEVIEIFCEWFDKLA
jgi:hypothetical protein